MNDTKTPLDIHAEQSFNAYHSGAKALRTWLVAYGIGGPILFLSQDALAIALAASPQKYIIIALFLGGLSAQILIAILNKWVNWYSYSLTVNPVSTLARRHKLVIWLANQFWIDMICDIISSVTFVVGTLLILRIALA